MIDESAAPLIHGGAQTPRAPLPMLPPLALYIHIPWFVRTCSYCDFNSHTARPQLPAEGYVDALLAALDQDFKAVYGREMISISLGGDTASQIGRASGRERVCQ